MATAGGPAAPSHAGEVRALIRVVPQGPRHGKPRSLNGADPTLERGFIVLADLSGFTTFVSETEVRHGAEVVAALLGAVIHEFVPSLEVEEIEGDAVFAVARDRWSAATPAIVPIVERAYVAFRERRRQIRLSTRCACRACRDIDRLDLKFVVHYGEFVPQRIGRRHKPTGPAVILAHRLLKAVVPGTRAWLLLTGPARERSGPDVRAAGFEERRLDCGSLGMVDVRLTSLEPAWHRYLETPASVEPQSALFVLEFHFPAVPEVLWDWLTLPELRRQYEPGAIAIGGTPDSDPRSVEFRCDQGAFEILEMVREWRPYRSCTRDTVIRPFGLWLRATWTLTGTGSATHLAVAVGSVPSASWISRLAGRLAARTLRRNISHAMASLATRLASL